MTCEKIKNTLAHIVLVHPERDDIFGILVIEILFNLLSSLHCRYLGDQVLEPRRNVAQHMCRMLRQRFSQGRMRQQ